MEILIQTTVDQLTIGACLEIDGIIRALPHANLHTLPTMDILDIYKSRLSNIYADVQNILNYPHLLYLYD